MEDEVYVSISYYTSKGFRYLSKKMLSFVNGMKYREEKGWTKKKRLPKNEN